MTKEDFIKRYVSGASASGIEDLAIKCETEYDYADLMVMAEEFGVLWGSGWH
jgi:hypothetical protein